MRVLLGSLIILIAGCAATPSAMPAAGLPALASLPQRGVSAVVQRAGNDVFAQSPSGVLLQAGAAELTAPANGSAWVIYQFASPSDVQIRRLRITAAAQAEYWVAISFYAQGRWKILGGAQTGNADISFAEDPGVYSSTSFTYVAVLANRGNAVTVADAKLDVPGPAMPDWQHTWGQSSTQSEIYHGMTTAPDGSYLAVGETNGTLTLSRHAAAGNLLSCRKFGGFPTSGQLLACASDGSVVMLCPYKSGGSLNPNAAYVLKTDSALNVVWTKLLRNPDPANVADLTKDFGLKTKRVLLSPAGDVYICGSALVTDANDQGFILKLFAPDGTVDWAQIWNTAEAQELVYLNGAIYIAGLKVDTVQGDREFILKLDEDGNVLAQQGWKRRLVSPIGVDFGGTLIADDQGGLLMADMKNNRCGIARFDAAMNLTQQFDVNLYDNSFEHDSWGVAKVCLDQAGNILVAGGMTFKAGLSVWSETSLLAFHPDGTLIDAQALTYPSGPMQDATQCFGLTTDGSYMYLAGGRAPGTDRVLTPLVVHPESMIFAFEDPALSLQATTAFLLTDKPATPVDLTLTEDRPADTHNDYAMYAVKYQ